ncbi:UNVERIFIED_CONTAM: hypothetical protein Sradi_1313400 [Sesamum radiatum]|uniref:Uncharacterized protein n=1 Tax=Sesamum radiatum TaxID=300843 RepID=A0AAW2UPP4_SESRA
MFPYLVSFLLFLRCNRSFDFPILLQVVTLRGELLSHPIGDSGEAQRWILGEQVEHLLGEVTDLQASKKVGCGRYQQAEREVKKLQKKIAAMKEDHAEEIQMLAD